MTARLFFRYGDVSRANWVDEQRISLGDTELSGADIPERTADSEPARQ